MCRVLQSVSGGPLPDAAGAAHYGHSGRLRRAPRPVWTLPIDRSPTLGDQRRAEILPCARGMGRRCPEERGDSGDPRNQHREQGGMARRRTFRTGTVLPLCPVNCTLTNRKLAYDNAYYRKLFLSTGRVVGVEHHTEREPRADNQSPEGRSRYPRDRADDRTLQEYRHTRLPLWPQDRHFRLRRWLATVRFLLLPRPRGVAASELGAMPEDG